VHKVQGTGHALHKLTKGRGGAVERREKTKACWEEGEEGCGLACMRVTRWRTLASLSMR
jgi:hypothetical protein